ncbi:MAG: DUF1559 domain-containing protein [Pirellulales bacterium]|nr:DUF1559 domain-containing protein [Pirellulales bacterium]
MAFTLVELLVSVAMIGIMIGLLLPAVQAAREAGRQAKCRSNLRQLGIALHSYHDSFGYFPTGCTERGRKQLAWSVFILPYIEQENVWRLIDVNRPYTSAANREATTRIIPTYLCPSTARLEYDRVGYTTGDRNNNGRQDPGEFMGVTDYGGIYGAAMPGITTLGNGVMLYDKAIKIVDICDGTSQTVVVAENTGRGWAHDGEWANGENIFDQYGRINDPDNRDLNEMWSDHPGGVQTLFCDGSVHFLRDEMDLKTLEAICTRNGRDVLTQVIP